MKSKNFGKIAKKSNYLKKKNSISSRSVKKLSLN